MTCIPLGGEHGEYMSHFIPGANPMALCPSLMEKGAQEETRKGYSRLFLRAGHEEWSRV